MTPDQKAREIAALWVKAGQIFTSKTLGEASDLLDAAIREARNAALEEAAKVASNMAANEYRANNVSGIELANGIAALILALKDKPDDS